MPLLKIHVLKGRTPEEIDRLLDATHEAMVASFKVPSRHRYQILTEHEPSHLRALDTGLDLPRTGRFLLLERCCGIARSDVMISFTQNSDEDWSFGNGRAQFLTGEL